MFFHQPQWESNPPSSYLTGGCLDHNTIWLILLAYQLVIVPPLYKATLIGVRNPGGAADHEHGSGKKKEKDVASVCALLVNGHQRGKRKKNVQQPQWGSNNPRLPTCRAGALTTTLS